MLTRRSWLIIDFRYRVFSFRYFNFSIKFFYQTSLLKIKSHSINDSMNFLLLFRKIVVLDSKWDFQIFEFSNRQIAFFHIRFLHELIVFWSTLLLYLQLCNSSFNIFISTSLCLWQTIYVAWKWLTFDVFVIVHLKINFIETCWIDVMQTFFFLSRADFFIYIHIDIVDEKKMSNWFHRFKKKRVDLIELLHVNSIWQMKFKMIESLLTFTNDLFLKIWRILFLSLSTILKKRKYSQKWIFEWGQNEFK